jgi:hypothetical protein
MSSRSVEEVRQELASEREGLTEAVDDFREEGGKLKSKLPLLLGGAFGALVALKAVARRARQRK